MPSHLTSSSTPLWQPSETCKQHSQMHAFMQAVSQMYSLNFLNYESFYQWSIDCPSQFWEMIARFCQVQFHAPHQQIMTAPHDMLNCRWFTGATLNFAENLLRRRDNHPALLSYNEQGKQEALTYAMLYQNVAKLAQHLLQLGVKPGERVVGFLPNIPAAVIGMLAATSIGAVWSACATDFGLDAILDRFQQIEPIVLITVSSHCYAGKQHNHDTIISTLQNSLPSLRQTILITEVEALAYATSVSSQPVISLEKIFQQPACDISFKPLPFDHPIYILYSSGTTGKPKCIVHGAGGTLLQHQKELRLHSDLTANDCLLFYTSTGWMMWNWMVSGLSIGATLVLYDGSPTHPKKDILFDILDEANVTHFGTSAKFLSAIEKADIKPRQSHKFTHLKCILSTGSPLLPDQFHFVYDQIKPDCHLASISGGTDIVSCFALGNPLLPVYAGELQCRGLGMQVEVFNDAGQPILNSCGELVCTAPFPAQPIYFWNDPDKQKYKEAYFNTFEGIWRHGDYAKLTERGSLVIYGRSDATLNPKGVRVGTAEIYRQVEAFNEINESLAITQHWQNDERIILFVTMQPGKQLDDKLKTLIQQTIKQNTSPNHVPAKIIAVPALPKTLNGKLVELAVKKVVHGEAISNRGALLNPECLDSFSQLTELQED